MSAFSHSHSLFSFLSFSFLFLFLLFLLFSFSFFGVDDYVDDISATDISVLSGVVITHSDYSGEIEHITASQMWSYIRPNLFGFERRDRRIVGVLPHVYRASTW